LLVEGPGAAEAVEAEFHPASGRPMRCFPADQLLVGHFGCATGEEVVVRRRAESVELHCHGGLAAAARIEEILLRRGCRSIAWRDWAFEHHQDPIRAAAHLALADARTERTALILLDQYNGALHRELEEIRAALAGRDAASALRRLEALLARAKLGRHLVEPWQVVLAGGANVGKSSLINAMVGYPRAIVHHAPGTTRDVLTAATAIDGWPLELSDTAGLRNAVHPIERAGVELAQDKLSACDLVVLVFDSSRPWSAADRRLFGQWPDALVVCSKCDLRPAGGERPGGLATSALSGEGIGRLLDAIADRLVPKPPQPGDAVPFTAAQVEHLQSVRAAILGADPASAASLLGRI